MKSILKKLTLIMGSLLVVGGLSFAPAVYAQDCKEGVGLGVSYTDTTGKGQCSDNGGTSFSALVKNIINIFSVVVGAVSVIMIIIGGFRYIISNGDQNGVQGAKNTILYAIVGLVIVLFAQLIVRFVLTSVTETQ